MFVCSECNNSYSKLNGLLTHLIRVHNISSKQHYDTTIKTGNEGLCENCGSETKFKNFTNGYFRCCSNKCSGIVKMAKLKSSEKYEVFVEKVRKNSISMHQSFSEERKFEIINKRIKSLNEANFYKKHSVHMKNWWLNIDEETKNNLLKNNLCKKRTKEEISKIRQKAVQTRVRNGNAVDRSSLDNLNNYRNKVNRLTNKTYSSHIDELDPNRLRDRTNFHIDHKVSILEGFLNNVDPEIISHKNNLRLISAKQNISKSWRSSITLVELLNSINDRTNNA